MCLPTIVERENMVELREEGIGATHFVTEVDKYVYIDACTKNFVAIRVKLSRDLTDVRVTESFTGTTLKWVMITYLMREYREYNEHLARSIISYIEGTRY